MTNLLYSHQSAGTAVVFWSAQASQAESLTIASKAWATIGLELQH